MKDMKNGEDKAKSPVIKMHRRNWILVEGLLLVFAAVLIFVSTDRNDHRKEEGLLYCCFSGDFFAVSSYYK